MQQRRPVLADPDVLEALAHPVRLHLLEYLMSDGPATATACAEAVNDSASNCSYHLRVLARHGLVERQESSDGRERPWQATITGFDTAETDQNSASAQALMAASLQLDQSRTREYLTARDSVSPAWRRADAYGSYTLRATPVELRTLMAEIDALIRPYIASIRTDAPRRAELVHLGFQAFPRTGTA